MRYTEEQRASNRKKWIEALESGEYEQGKKRLRTEDDGYCCLGVACDISELGEWVDYEGDYEYKVGYYSRGASLLDALVDWLGLWDDLGVTREGNYRSLYIMNDEGASF